MASPTYHTGPRGFIGYNFTFTAPSGNNFVGAIPAFVAVDEFGNSVGTSANPTPQAATPTTSANNAIVPIVGSAVSSLVVKASPGNFYSASMVAGATAGFLIAYNAAAAPSGGASLTATQILAVAPVAANSYANLGGNPLPDRFGTGIVLLFSTSTTTYTVPANLALFMRGSAA